jgi:hypothetical protein
MENEVTIKCSKCGYEKRVQADEVRYDNECPLCRGTMKLAKAKVQTAGELVAGATTLVAMSKTIHELGAWTVWKIIESYPKAQTRAAYRRLYFKAGGTAPQIGV